MSGAYKASPLKPRRHRRTRRELDRLDAALRAIVAEETPVTVRQVYYQAVVRGLVGKDERSYDLVGRRLLEMRHHREIPWIAIADNTRWMRKPTTYDNLEHALETTRRAYRRDLWNDQNAYVEIWLEKDALAGVLYDVTEDWHVPLMVSRGFASASFLHSASEEMANIGKPSFIYYFGDHDPSGVSISKTIERDLRRFAPGIDLTFERVAVTVEQIASMNLPTRPTKTTDTRSKGFVGESVEVDAISPNQLRAIAKQCITKHIDHAVLLQTFLAEKAERESLEVIMRRGAA